MWQLNSRVLEQAYYHFWSGGDATSCVFEENKTVDGLKQLLVDVDVWQGVQQSALDNALDELRKRLRACIRTKEVTFWAYPVTVESTYIIWFVSCCFFSVKSRIYKLSVSID